MKTNNFQFREQLSRKARHACAKYSKPIYDQITDALNMNPFQVETLYDLIILSESMNKSAKIMNSKKIIKKSLWKKPCLSMPNKIMAYPYTRTNFIALLCQENYTLFPTPLLNIIGSYIEGLFVDDQIKFNRNEIQDQYYYEYYYKHLCEFNNEFRKEKKSITIRLKVRRFFSGSCEHLHYGMMIITPCCKKLMCISCFLIDVKIPQIPLELFRMKMFEVCRILTDQQKEQLIDTQEQKFEDLMCALCDPCYDYGSFYCENNQCDDPYDPPYHDPHYDLR